ncbi:Fe2OG dioxygenase domain-containing protein [Psidium guajava]|nr:Fe2OG dioxygenase domain-containing protein [Psidium guajava]
MAIGGRNGGLRDDAQETGAPILRDDALQRLEQRLMERLKERIDYRLRHLEERFDEIVDRFETLGVNVNRNRQHGRRPGADVVCGDPVDRHVLVRKQNNPLFLESSEEEEEDEFTDEERVDYGCRRPYGRC